MAAAKCTVATTSKSDKFGVHLRRGTLTFDTGDYSAGGVSVPQSEIASHYLWQIEIPDDVVSNVLYKFTYDEAEEKVVIWTVYSDGDAGDVDQQEHDAAALPAGLATTFRTVSTHRY